MYKFEDPLRTAWDQETAVRRALQQTDRDLFDEDEARDEDLVTLYETMKHPRVKVQ